MKKILPSVLMLLLFLYSCSNSKQNDLKGADALTDSDQNSTTNDNMPSNANAVKGDFNGDGTSEWMWLVPPKVKEDEMDCVDKCVCTIKFSNPQIPDLTIDDQCIDGLPQNENDLNGDGSDEISIIPDWFTSSWRNVNVYHLTNNGWELLIRPLTYWTNGDSTLDYVQKDVKKPGHVIIREYRWTEDMDDVVIASESIKLD